MKYFPILVLLFISCTMVHIHVEKNGQNLIADVTSTNIFMKREFKGITISTPTMGDYSIAENTSETKLDENALKIIEKKYMGHKF